jgi:CRISPR-associated endonuclease/helicase Cas3
MIGTVDQALLGALRARHAHLRGAALLRSLLVIDEVHASDAYMTGLLEETLVRHVRAGGHAVLLSATLGGGSRDRLVKAGQPAPRPKPGSAPAPEPDYTTAPYPLVSDCRGARVAPSAGPTRVVRLDLRAEIADADVIARAAAEAARAGARVLVVRNTVGTAMLVQRALEMALADAPTLLFMASGAIAMHHGR